MRILVQGGLLVQKRRLNQNSLFNGGFGARPLGLVRARASISWEIPTSPTGSFALVAAQQPQAATSTRLLLSPAPSVRGQRPPSPCPQPLPARRRRPPPRCPPSLPPHRPPWLRW